MPRKLRVEYPGAVYFVESHAPSGKWLFETEADRRDFLKLLGDSCRKTGWFVHAYSLLRDRFLLVLETPKPNLALGMRWFVGSYSIRNQNRHSRSGAVFSGRYKSIPIETRSQGYLQIAADYVHLQRAMVWQWPTNRTLAEDPWTSLGGYGASRTERPPWLRVDKVLAEHGLLDTAAGRRKFAKIMEERRALGAEAPEWKPMRRGWFLGTPKFRQELLSRMPAQLRALGGGAFRVRTDQSKAEAIIREELKKLGWNEGNLKKARKLASEKLGIAARVRRETTLPVRWIAARLRLGVYHSATAQLHAWMKTHPA